MAILNQAQLSSSITNTEGGLVTVTTNSNTQRTNKVDTDILLVKSSGKSWGIPKEEILVTTIITNNMDVNLEDFFFQDTLSNGATFVEGSLKVGSEPREELNPIDGFDLSVTIGALGGECDISYSILIDETPRVDEVSIQSSIVATIEGKQFDVTSQIAKIQILNNEVYILKEADLKIVKSGEEITYTLTITNAGSLENSNLILTDPLPPEISFVQGSVLINNVSSPDANPEQGITLPNLGTGESITVSFKASVK